MLRHVWTVLCQKTIIDKKTNNVSIVEALEEIKVNYKTKDKKKPARINLPIHMELVTLWIKDRPTEEVTADVEVLLIDPEGNQIGKASHQLLVKPSNPRFRSNVNFDGLALTTSGEYKFIVQTNGAGSKNMVQVAEVPLTVTLKED